MKKSLMISINAYPDCPLRGCVNDTLLMYKGMAQNMGFKTDNMQTLIDSEATKKNIIVGLKKLVTGASEGDVLLCHYSGHGSQVMVDDWTNTDEVDGRDEILCPFDLDWEDPLRDHDLGAIVKTVPKGVKFVVILDCCHSGTGLRNTIYADPTKAKTNQDILNRFMPPPVSNVLSNPKAMLDDDLNFIFDDLSESTTQTNKNGFMIDTAKQGEAILISGCRDNQTSADAWINGRFHGALTYYLYKTLYDNNFEIPYGELIDKINEQLIDNGYDQEPQLECREEYFNNLFLG